MLRKILFTIIMLSIILAGCAQEENLSIGILQTVEHPTLETTYQGIVDQISKYNSQNEKPIEVLDLKINQGQLVSKNYSMEANAEDLDLILAISSKSLYDLYQTENKIPIIFTAVSDLSTINFSSTQDTQARIITGVSDMIPIETQFQLLTKLIPTLKTVGVIYNPKEKLSKSQIELIKKYESNNNISCIYQEVNSPNGAIDAAKNLLGEIDALYIPSDLTVTPVIQDIITWTELANKPLVSGDERGIEQGALCTVVVDYYKLGQQTGMLAIETLTKITDLEEHPLEKSKHNKILINTDAAEKLNIIIPRELQDNINS